MSLIASDRPAGSASSLAASPRPRLRAGRLRALVPPVLAALCWMADVPGGPWLLAIGLAGAVIVWREDGLAPISAWTARFPKAPWGDVQRLPSGAQRGALVRVCEEVEGAMRDLSAAEGAPSLDPRAVRRELAGLLALAADLAAQVEQLERLQRLAGEEAPADPRLARVRETLDSVLPAIRRLRATLQRAAAPGVSAHRPRLGSLLTLERELSAHQDCIDELEDLPCAP